jgi:acyl-CoA thioesterase-2
MAASRTAPGRTPHSVHVYYLRAGDARHPVDFQVVRSRDGGTLSTRQVTARQDGEVLLEALASFSTPVDGLGHQLPIADVPQPESLPPVQDQLAAYADEHRGHWVRPQPFELRYVDPPPRLAVELSEASPRIWMWWRPTEPVPDDAVLHSCLLTYLSGPVVSPAGRPIRLGALRLVLPSGVGGRGLASATMYNRAGQLVCIATQELYFGRAQAG